MTRKSMILSLVAAACALFAGPLHAQAVGVAKFKTPFPFYVGNQKMPAGAYMVVSPNINDSVLLIHDVAWSHSAFVEYTPTVSTTPFVRGVATFDQFGDADYLRSLTLTGEETGMEMPKSMAEERATQAKQTVASMTSVPLQAGSFGD